MKTLCFTSVSSRDLALCARIFHQAGMATPRAASNRAGLDMYGWHEQVLSANTRDSFQPVTEPGTFHVQLASDIFIANMEQALWGWQSVTNTFFLDFWQRFDPNIFFVLVCLPPACLVARELESGNNDPDTQQILGTWQIHHQEMLAFYHRHPDRCLCLDARALFSNPSAAVDLCATTWKLPLEKDRISTPTSLLPDPLAWFLAQQMVTGHDEEAASLWQEVEATVHPLEGEALMDQPGSKAILARYSDLCEHSGKLVKLEADQSKLQEENSKILSQLHHAQEGLEKTCRANQQLETEQQKIIQDNDALSKDKATLTQRISEQDAKTKQLESEKQKLVQDNDALNKDKTTLEQRISELDARTKQLDTEKQKLVQDNGTLNKDKATLTQRINELDAKTKQLESEKQKIIQDNDALSKDKTTLEQRISELDARTKQLDTEKQKLVQDNDALSKDKATLTQRINELDAKTKQLEGKIKDSEEENELLLLQLHQVQEELETTFLENQKLDDTSNRLEKEKAALEKRINELDAKTKQLETEKQKLVQDNGALNKDKAALTQRTSQLDAKTKQLEGKIKDSEEENELLLLQLHQVQEELETTFLKNQKLDDTSNRLEKEKAALEKRINELDAKTKQLESEKQKLAQDNGALSKDKATLTQRIAGLEARTKELETHNQQQKKEIETGGRHAQKIEELENRLRDTSDENELLLLQLHQVQEELEKYFLGNQKTQQQLDEIESRWQRLQQRYPAYCDYTDLSIEEHDKTLRWIFNEYLGGGRKIDRLCVDLNLKKHVAGLTLSRENIHDSSPLVYWPKLHQDATSLDLAPNALTREQALALVHTYSQIATSDWLWLQDLGAAMIDHLESDHPALDHIDESLREQFIQGLDLHQEKLESLPPVLRCDAVHLVQEHSANGYEHIWLRLENPHFTNSQCSDFEFRLACVNDSGAGHDLGNHPRLEFPDQGDDTLLVNWFMESENQFGANLELRFALPDIMDTDLWARLDQEDAALISSLLEQLPFFLDREKDALAGLRRPKKQWIDLARKMAAIHRRWTEHAANAKETA